MSASLTISRKPTVPGLLEFLLGATALVGFDLLYAYFYEHHLVPRWGYFGFRFEPQTYLPYWNGVLCTLIGYLVLPRQARVASDYVHWLLFVLAFVPIQLTIGLSNSIPGGIVKYQFALLLSLLLSVLIAHFAGSIASKQTYNVRDLYIYKKIKHRNVPRVLALLSVFIVSILILRFYSIMHFSGIEEVYEQRERASDLGVGSLYGYLILWATYLIAPLMIATGLTGGRNFYLILAFFLLTVVYMITASKITFVIILLSLSIHYFNKFGLRHRMYLLFCVPILPMLLSISFDLANDNSLGPVASYALDQIVVRGIAIQPMIFNLYLEFFATNPHTYYSHVTGVSWFLDYPYDLPVGRVISIYQYGHPNANANSGIWATDGVAAAGWLGIVIVGVLLGTFLGFANSITKNVGQEFLSITMLSLAMLMVNVSLFTTIASGGGFLLVILIPHVWRHLQQ